MILLTTGGGVSAAAERDVSFSLETAWLYGDVDGHVQTSSGGEPGTTSDKRPTLGELGIDNASIYDAQGAVAVGHHQFYAGGQWFRLSGDATLTDTLISQGNTFPAGTQMDSEIQLDWYRFGYRYEFELKRPSNRETWMVISPIVGGAVLDFRAQIDGSNGADVDHSDALFTAQVGFDVEWRVTHAFSVSLEALSSIPVTDWPTIFTTKLTANYRILDRGDASLTLFGGIAYELIHFDDADKQEVPNEIEIDAGPLFIVGLEGRF